jgi:hypothetical protein
MPLNREMFGTGSKQHVDKCIHFCYAYFHAEYQRLLFDNSKLHESIRRYRCGRRAGSRTPRRRAARASGEVNSPRFASRTLHPAHVFTAFLRDATSEI